MLAAVPGEETLLLVADPNQQSAVIAGTAAKAWSVRDWDDITEALEYMRQEGYKHYRWWGLDSLTHFQERGVDHIMQEIIDSGKTHRRKWLADRGDIGQNMNRISLWFRDAILVPSHFVVTAHTMRSEIELDDGETEVLWVPAVQGKGMPAKICSYMNLVGFMFAQRVEGGVIRRRMLTEKDSSHYAKDNWYAALGGVMDNPTLPKIEARIDRKREALAAASVPSAAKQVPTKKMIARS
jgi:hypothetical protein